ncbi:DUF4328 domain-containing protein [Streptomyces sp. NPDC091212]|uniref:protein kinase domain-containing protein n=1 Tax=Streptomyces sp. NPDC091212 TaxID=3155191 RepID=UPI00343B9A1C
MDGLNPDDPGWIGSYRLLGRLGEGGMGRVYLARSERGRTVAVKVVREELARKPDFRRRFTLEVNAARRVGGEWTAPVLDADTDAPTPWVATGYVAGPSLTEVVDVQYGPLPRKSLRALAIGLIRALQAIHGAGLVHRDLKPSNVLVTIDGPRVIDFGIARALDTAAQSGDGLTGTGALVGSPGYMSPEQVRGERVSFASDVFCLGAVLAYTATGRLPFGTGEGGIHSLLFRIAEEEADLTGIPEPWGELIASCLAKDAAQRPSLEALLASIEGAADADGVPGAAPGAASGGAWLPGEVLAALGRHAVGLLDSEDPEGHVLAGSATRPGPAAAATAAAGAGAVPVAGFGPPLAYVPSTPPPWHSPAPGGFQAPAPAAYTPFPPPARSARALSVALTILLCLFVLPLLLRGFVLAVAYSRLGAQDSMSSPDAIGDFADLRFATMAAEGLNMLMGVVVATMWLFWFQRTRFNAESFAPGRLRYASGLASGSWFIPIVNLYMPKRIADDIWTATTGRPTGDQRWRLHTWWWLWLGYLVVSAIDSISSWYDGTFVVEATDSIVTAQFSNLLGIVSTVLAILFVTRLTTLQQARIAGHARGLSW